LVLVAKELYRELPRIDFEQPGTEEYRADADAHRKQKDRERKALQLGQKAI
jgi:hypothetical protein